MINSPTHSRIKEIKLVSNIPHLRNYDNNIIVKHEYFQTKDHNVISLLKNFYHYRNYDYFLFNGSSKNLFLLCLYKILIPFHKTKIISLDLLLPEPKSLFDNFKRLFRIILLSKIYMFFLYYKNTKGIEYYYKIPSSKFRYIPFKINQYSKVLNAETKDLGYVFCGGKTRRDFDTLIKAVQGTDIPVRIVTMENKHIAEHGSYLNESDIPENVEVIKLDGSFDPFLKYMAESRLVVLPLKPHICGTGIGVYIMAMALKKCMIISDDVSVQDILNDDMAILVPPENPNALKDAIIKAYNKHNYRKKFEINGYNYAIKLKGEEKLYESIVNTIIEDYINSKNCL